MASYLEHLNKDTFPSEMLADFVAWCVWEQARPALVAILQKTGLDDQARQIANADDYVGLAAIAHEAAQHIAQVRKITGVLGLSSAEAASFLTNRLAVAAGHNDAEDVAFFSAQLAGWQAFAEANFTDPKRKIAEEHTARDAQDAKLQALYREYSEEAAG